MTVREIIERRIYLKKQLIFLVRREIKTLQKELKDLKPDAPQSGHEAKGGKV